MRESRYDFSRKITGSRVITLTGAGSTEALGLCMMDSFIDLLEDKLQDSKKDLGDRPIKMLDQIVNKYGRDLEKVLKRLEEYRSIINITSNDPVPAHAFGQTEHFKSFKETAEQLDSVARQLIFDHYRDVPAERAFEVFQAFLDLLAEANKETETIPYFTTNYDAVIETTVDQAPQDYTIRDGFRQRHRGFVWAPETLEEYDGYNRTTIILAKLHGSIYWYRREDEDEIFKYPDTIAHAQGFWPILLYPVDTTKTLDDVGEPFRTIYELLSASLRHAEYCICVGYSFRDPILQEAIKTLDEESRPEFVVVRPGMREKSEVKKLEGQLGVTVHPLPYKFGREEHEQLMGKLREIVLTS